MHAWFVYCCNSRDKLMIDTVLQNPWDKFFSHRSKRYFGGGFISKNMDCFPGRLKCPHKHRHKVWISNLNFVLMFETNAELARQHCLL